MKKPRAILNPLTIIRHVRLIQNNYSLPFFNNTLWNVGQSVVFFFSSSSSFSFAYSLRMWALVPKIFEAYISTCVLARAMKLLIQAFQRYIILPKSFWSSSLLLKPAIKRFFKVWFIHPFVSRDNLQCISNHLKKFRWILTCHLRKKW